MNLRQLRDCIKDNGEVVSLELYRLRMLASGFRTVGNDVVADKIMGSVERIMTAIDEIEEGVDNHVNELFRDSQAELGNVMNALVTASLREVDDAGE